MPFIKIKTSCGITAAQEKSIKTLMGKAIALVPGKSEQYLLMELEDSRRLWLRGKNDSPIAYIEAAVFANEAHLGYDAFTACVTYELSEILDIAPDHVYIKFEDIPAWGVQGAYMDIGARR